MIIWSDVTAVAPELSAVAAGTQTAILAVVEQMLSDDDVWQSTVRLDQGRAYLAAHLATVIRRRGGAGPVQSETAGNVSRSFAVFAEAYKDLGSTGYGSILELMIQALPLARIALAEE